MRFATSCSKTLIRCDWRRFWPVAFLYAFISFFMLPLPLWINRNTAVDVGSSSLGRDTAGLVLDMLPGFVILTFFFGLILAMAVYSYLMTARSVGLMHALPVRRDRQFLIHFLAGLSMLTAANALTFLLALGMETVSGGVEIRSLLLWLMVTELTGFFFLAFASLCAVITGWLLAVPVIYAGFNFVTLVYWAILNGLAGILHPSYVDVSFSNSAVVWLTPVVKLADATGHRFPRTLRPGFTADWLPPGAIHTVLIYAAAGVAMMALALLLYRRRHSETAGDAVAFQALRPVARYMISIAGGLGLGTLVYRMVSWGGRNTVSLILWQILMGTLTYCAVEMLLRKSYKIFDRRTAAGLLALWLVVAGICGGMKLDVFGLEKWTPAPEKVEAVQVYGSFMSAEADDPDTIKAAIELHKALTDDGGQLTGEGRGVWNVVYRLKNGTEARRTYNVNLDNPAVYQAMTALMNRPEIRRGLLMDDYGRFGDTFTGGYASCYTNDRDVVLSAEQCLKLYRALEADMGRDVSPETQLCTASNIWVELTTTEGDYILRQIRPDCADTIAVLLELGVIDSEEDLEFVEYGHSIVVD